MSFQRVDGVLNAVMKAAAVDERAATELLRYSLYESLGEQIDQARPRLEQDGIQMLAKRSAQARSHLLRSTVGKALDGGDDSVDLDTAQGLAIIDAFVEKSLVGNMLRWFNQEHPRDAHGQWVKAGGSNNEDNGPEPASDSQEVLDARAMFTGARNKLYDAENKARSQQNNAADWNRPGDFRDRQAYRRMSLTGSALQAISTPGSHGHAVGVAAQLAGNIGPEAERVLGPGVRRTAYRYRGTEKRPDKALVADVAAAQKLVDGLAGEDPTRSIAQTTNDILADYGSSPTEAQSIAGGVAATYLKSGMDRDQLELAIRGDTAAVGLIKAVPNERLTEISIAAGELPPSQGVIIDADGDLTSQAQGYNGDHYLPFDLKNLADLQGGQYVRTRAAGGPTTEDLYTGLLSGARQIQVISNSGVFTLEFDPDIRGGRRYTDKAQRMISRYSKLLEAIDGGELYDEDIAPESRRRLRQLAYEQTGWDAEEGAKRYRELRAQERLKSSFNQVDEDQRFKEAVEQVKESSKKNNDPRMSHQQIARAAEDLVRRGNVDAAAKRVRQMVLDGKGYAKALKTLQQEFPFYIRDVRFEDLPEFTESRKTGMKIDSNAFSRDRGYVKPGQTNAHASLRRDKEGAINDKRLVATRRLKGEVSEDSEENTPTARSSSRSISGGPLKAAVKDEEGIVSPTEGDTIPLIELLAKKPYLRENLGRAISKVEDTFAVLNNEVKGNGARLLQTEEQSDKPGHENTVWGTSSNMQWAEYMNTKKSKEEGTSTVAWLMNEATLEQRTKFARGFKDAGDLLRKSDPSGTFVQAMGGDGYDTLIDQIVATISLKEPFVSQNDATIETKPDVKYPRPLYFSSISSRGDKVINYDKYLAMARQTNPRLTKKIDEYTADVNAAPGDIDDQIEALRKLRTQPAMDKAEEENLRRELNSSQMAWAFVVGKALAEVVDESPKVTAPQEGPTEAEPPSREVPPDPSPPTSPPKARKPAGGAGSTRAPQHLVGKSVIPARTVVFHKNSDEYNRAMDRAFRSS